MKRPRLDTRALGDFYEAVMRALAKVVTDRRWAAPLSAMALGFGLFLGVAIGPGTDGSLATPAAQILAIAEPEPEPEAASGAGESAGAAFETAPEPVEEEASFEPAPIAEEFSPEPVEEEPAPEPQPQPPATEPEPEAEESEDIELEGTVVRANPAARSYTVAAPAGELVSVHAPKLPAAGTKLAITAAPLANNTFGESARKAAGRATAASFSGVVTFVDPDPAAPVYTVSGRGSSILVHADPAQAATLPALGAYAKVSVGLEKAPIAAPEPEAPPLPAPPLEPLPLPPAPPCAADPALKAPAAPKVVAIQRSLEVEPEAEPATYVDLAGIVSGICPDTGQLLISADDMRESGDDLLLAVPARFEVGGLGVGDSVLATATLDEEGGLTLAGLASDEGSKGAADAESAQGDLAR